MRAYGMEGPGHGVAPWSIEGAERRDQIRDELREVEAAYQGMRSGQRKPRPKLRPAGTDERSRNPFRPENFDGIVGQDEAKDYLRHAIAHCQRTDESLPHLLFVGPAGVGKSTFSHVIAHELGVQVWEVQAPISYDTLAELRESMSDRDILRIEEIHLQAIQERRGATASTKPEVLYALLEDFVLQTPQGVEPFPRITVVGTTTDEGMLPDAFISRFLPVILNDYTYEDMAVIAVRNANVIGLSLDTDAAKAFALASRLVPRHVNNYIKAARIMAEGDTISFDAAYAVVRRQFRTTLDGLTADMQTMLRFLFDREKHQASVQAIATACGKSRDVKAVQLRIEPWLIKQGLVEIAPRGRQLTSAGIERARLLIEGDR